MKNKLYDLGKRKKKVHIPTPEEQAASSLDAVNVRIQSGLEKVKGAEHDANQHDRRQSA